MTVEDVIGGTVVAIIVAIPIAVGVGLGLHSAQGKSTMKSNIQEINRLIDNASNSLETIKGNMDNKINENSKLKEKNSKLKKKNSKLNKKIINLQKRLSELENK